MKRKTWAYIWTADALIWMVVIFMKSAEPYQEQDMRPFLKNWISEERLTSWLPHISFTYDGHPVTWQKPYDMLEFFIRKAGHVAEFALLMLFVTLVLLSWRKAFYPMLCLGTLISVGYAATDEWHQTFVPGRTGHVVDVLVDSIGIVLVALIWLLVHVCMTKANLKPAAKEKEEL